MDRPINSYDIAGLILPWFYLASYSRIFPGFTCLVSRLTGHVVFGLIPVVWNDGGAICFGVAGLCLNVHRMGGFASGASKTELALVDLYGRALGHARSFV